MKLIWVYNSQGYALNGYTVELFGNQQTLQTEHFQVQNVNLQLKTNLRELKPCRSKL